MRMALLESYDNQAGDTGYGEAPPASKQILRSAMQAYSQGQN